MTEQLAMLGASRHDELAVQFARFDCRHPEIWRAFERFALELAAAGDGPLGARLVLERVRWELALEPREGRLAVPRVNNNFAPFYARRFARVHPRLADRFRFRRLRSQRSNPKHDHAGPRFDAAVPADQAVRQ